MTHLHDIIGTSLVAQWLGLHLPMQGMGLIAMQGGKTPCPSRQNNQKITQKQYCNKLKKDFKNCPYPKKNLKKNMTS